MHCLKTWQKRVRTSKLTRFCGVVCFKIIEWRDNDGMYEVLTTLVGVKNYFRNNSHLFMAEQANSFIFCTIAWLELNSSVLFGFTGKMFRR